MSKDIYDMTIREIVETGAKINVNYHNYPNGSANVAHEQIKQFKTLGTIHTKSRNGTNWLEMEDENVEVASFYEVNEIE